MCYVVLILVVLNFRPHSNKSFFFFFCYSFDQINKNIYSKSAVKVISDNHETFQFLFQTLSSPFHYVTQL